VLALDAEILLHQRGLDRLFLVLPGHFTEFLDSS
jgi:hypothetical protein